MKRKILPCFLLALVFLLSLGLSTSYASTYETEPNNTSGTADLLTEGVPMIGQIYNDPDDPDLDVDWFKLNVSAGEVIHGHIYGGSYTITVYKLTHELPEPEVIEVLAIVSGSGTEAVPLEIFAETDATIEKHYIKVEGTPDAYYTLTVAASEQPIANAGVDQIVNQGTTVILDGSNSSDPDHPGVVPAIASYHWTQTHGPTVTLSDATAIKPIFTAPNVGDSGIYLAFELTVTDFEGLRDTDSVIITVTYLNQPPTADAGPDQTVNEGVSVALDGSGSTDPDDGIVTYEWTQTHGKTVIWSSDKDLVQPTFTSPTVGPTGECLIFELTVTDAGDLIDTDEVLINVTSVNQPPTAAAGTDQDVLEGASVMLDGSESSDPDDGIATYAWTQLSGKNVTLTNSTESKPLFTAPDVGAEGEALIFELTVTDVGGLKDTDRVTVNVSYVNHPPSADAGPDQTVNEGVSVALDGSGSTDPDDGIATYLWTQTLTPGGSEVELSDPSAIQPTFTSPEDVGPTGECLIFELTVTDAGGLIDTDEVFINVTSVNLPPTAHAGTDQTAGEGATVTLNGSLSRDPDDGIATYAWTQLSGTTVTLSSASAVQPIFTAPDVGVAGESLIFELTVTDVGGLKDTDRVTIDVTCENQPPTADAGPDQTVNENVSVALHGSGSTDPDDGIAFYEWIQISGTPVSLSSNTTVNPAFMSPDVGINGESMIFQLTVTDHYSLQDSDRVTITVNWVNDPPTADAGPDQDVEQGARVTLDGSGSTDPDDGIASYEWTQLSGVSAELSDPSAVKPTFIAPNVGPAEEPLIFMLTVTDNGGLSDYASVTIKVKWENEPPVADAGPDQKVDEGTLVTLDGSGSTDPDDGIASYEWTQLSGTAVTLSDPSAVAPTFTVPDVDPYGELLTFELTVTDNGGLTSTDTCNVRILGTPGAVYVPEEYPTIQDGIDAVSEGGTVFVADGTYSGDGNRNLNFKGKAFTLKSQSGPDTCTINYSGVSRGFCFDTGEETDSILNGFTVTNGNVAGGGAGILCSNSSPTITNCVITANRTSWEGGGISCYFASPVIVNCVISENSAGQSGGGILCYYSSPVITNCTICGNSADRGGAISCFASFPIITNCILWGNSPDEINNNDPDVTYSDIEGGYDGEGNINADPLFAGNGDYHLTSSSPCIDSGTSVGAPPTDIEGTSRPQGAGYDMGAYEFTTGTTSTQGGLPWLKLLLPGD